ncbi:MAG: Lrp/AsnC ligand binding domain-containing protein [Crenarchaeota archaeon]|nr:Lrp/AsnC ligand binding domain-containing protein [Thermoproteota archaeon]MCR8454267.1 Lrp/AsnC ligand binding domain-containing protein [Thermoproteota archaeon]MCR8455035.1 Lrp/AsnC ligand binding domain-containing protein [Thermoproteota archaeon]MCR8463242.1 Lrp/AsnC ligand binding domain-containing protein [Thermoproteota archaeon]MCR8470483.1 Lrp/AsnC ligand binding domain-containing protein [Thermoproteota archaeon]
MPLRAFVFLKVRPAPVEDLRRELKKFPEIIEGYVVTGEIDVILSVETVDTNELFQLVKKIRALPFVLDTKTSIAISAIKEKQG